MQQTLSQFIYSPEGNIKHSEYLSILTFPSAMSINTLYKCHFKHKPSLVIIVEHNNMLIIQRIMYNCLLELVKNYS